MFLIYFGPTLIILVKEFKFGVFCCTNVRVTALFGLKSSYYNQILLLAEMAADDILELVFVETPHRLHCYSCKILHLLSGSCCLLC